MDYNKHRNKGNKILMKYFHYKKKNWDEDILSLSFATGWRRESPGVYYESPGASGGSNGSRNTCAPDGPRMWPGDGSGGGNRWFRLLYILFKINFYVNLVF